MGQRSDSFQSRNRVRSIVGTRKVIDIFFDMIKSSHSEISATMLYLGSKWSDDRTIRNSYYMKFQESVTQAVKNGAEVRIIAGITRESEELEDKIRKWGAKVRRFNHGSLRFVVRDSKDCMIVSSERFAENLFFYHAVWTDIEEVVGLFEGHFDSLWTYADADLKKEDG